MTKLTAKQKEVIRKIIYAVESGGQVYGKQDYYAFIDAGANTPNEVAITIGAGQWYGIEAKMLLDLIRSKNKNEFDKLDTQGIGNDLDNKNWNTYCAAKTSEKAKCIIKIMTTNTGIKCQDELMESQITTYAEDIQKKYGDMTVDAIAECINIKHQGGDGALKRILSKINKPYSAKSIKNALDLDPKDKSNNNQVGDYTLRQTKVYDMIVNYLIPTMETSTTTNNGGPIMTITENELRLKVANYLVPYVGIAEGSASHLKIINTFNNSKLCRRYTMTYKDAWCATGVSTTFIDLGLAGKSGSGKLFECCECSCGYMVELAQKQGIWQENDNYVPKVGDIVMYYWKDSGSGDCVGWPDHVGIVYNVNGNTSFKVIECNINDTVGYRTLSVNGKYIRGFITPNYAKFSSASVVSENKTTVESTTTVTLNKNCKYKGTVTSTELNIRSWAGTEYDILRVITKGTKVEVCDTIHDKNGNEWYYIKESGKYGFVSANYITKKTTTTTSTNSNTINKTCKFEGKVVADTGLRVRSWAGTEYDTLRVLTNGTKVEVCDEVKATTGKMWYYIKESGKYGFVSADYVARI